MVWFLRARKERRLAALDEMRQTRRLVEEDVTVFGEQLSELHVETLTTELDADMREDYQRSLDAYESAKDDLRAARDARTAGEIAAIGKVLDEGRYHLACVLARRDGEPLPERREPCFFNPQHGPSVRDIAWTPPGGVEREVPVCRSDLRRITGGEDPQVRMVRVGDRYVPWYAVEAARGLLVSAVGTRAVEGVPKYVMLEADIARSITNNNNTGGGFGI